MTNKKRSDYNNNRENKKRYRIEMLFTAMFAKYCQVVVINSKKTDDVLAGLLERLKQNAWDTASYIYK